MSREGLVQFDVGCEIMIDGGNDSGDGFEKD